MASINRKLLKEFLNELYPVGKTEIFLDNEDHSNYMGFTWQRDAIGRAIVGIDSTDPDFNAIGKTAGSKYLQAHTHNITKKWAKAGEIYGYTDATPYFNGYSTGTTVLNSGDVASGVQTGNSGNLQPYKVFAIWVRIS